MRIYFAGMESDFYDIAKLNKINSCFVSYYYMRNEPDQGIGRLNALKGHVKNVVVDSGAHTFFSERHDEGLSVSNLKKKTKTKETPEQYMEGYLNWLEKVYDLISYFVELDIGEIVTQAVVLKWREFIKAKKLYDKCITVYHPAVVSFDEYIGYLKDSQSKYVALEGERNNRPSLPYNKLIKPAYEMGVKVHGFALTDKKILDKHPFFSVDSTSWLAGIIYGHGFAITQDDVKFVAFNEKKEDTVALAKHHINSEEVYDQNKKVQGLARLNLAIDAFNKMEKYYTDYWNYRKVVWK